jgi:alpha-1,3-glucosyltransferase
MPALLLPPSSSVPPAVAAVALAVVVRVLMFSLPHSGEGRPPMHGDLEAQRHWMEVTSSLPLSSWYTGDGEGGDNDLQYWGLDYPPLTAFHSYLFGTVAQRAVPQLVELRASRGHESAPGKLFLRLTVLLSDLVVYVPACLALAAVVAAGARPAAELGRKRVAGTALPSLPLLHLLLLHPTLLVLDHGHFQYNGVSLGLALGAVAATARGNNLLCAFLFSLALNFKQMELYHSLPFFVHLLVLCLVGGGGGDGGKGPTTTTTTTTTTVAGRVRAVVAVGSVVLLTFALQWAPFCLAGAWTPAGRDGSDSSLRGCAAGLGSVLHRLFPFARNLFEDKVANLWCALEPITRFRARLAASPDAHGRVALLCACVTLLLALPGLAAHGAGLLLASGTPRTDDEGAVVGSPAKVFEKIAPSPAARRRRGSASSTTKAVVASRRSPSPAPPPPPSPAPSPSVAPSPPSPAERLLLSMGTCALAFFLASFQVHEKSILLAALPLAALYLRFPLLATWFTAASSWSLWPLLLKDGLLLPAAALTGAWLYVFLAAGQEGEGAEELGSAEGAAVAAGLRALGLQRRAGDGARLGLWLRRGAIGSAAVALVLSVAAWRLPTPSSLPDLHPYASSVYAAALFCVALGVGSLIQVGWGAERRPGGGRSD